MSTNPRVPYQLASQRAPLPPPQGGRLIVHVVVNIENWRFHHGMPRKLLPAPHGEFVKEDGERVVDEHGRRVATA